MNHKLKETIEEIAIDATEFFSKDKRGRVIVSKKGKSIVAKAIAEAMKSVFEDSVLEG